MKKKKKMSDEEFQKTLNRLKKSDFDGHTDFQKLSAKEKLSWLSQLILFKSKVKK